METLPTEWRKCWSCRSLGLSPHGPMHRYSSVLGVTQLLALGTRRGPPNSLQPTSEHVATPRICAWRYIEHPRFKYELIFANAQDDTAACGVIVYRIEPLAGQAECVVRIVDSSRIQVSPWNLPTRSSYGPHRRTPCLSISIALCQAVNYRLKPQDSWMQTRFRPPSPCYSNQLTSVEPACVQRCGMPTAC